MRRLISHAAALTLALVLLSLVPSAATSLEIATETPRKGPRTDDLVIRYYENVTAAYAALKAGEIDIVGYKLPPELYEDAAADPNIVLSGVADRSVYEFALNNNHTIHLYPGVENMFWYAPVRRAVAWCTDKDYIVDVICGGFAERIDAPIAASVKAWASQSYWHPNYPYEYDPAAASAHLDAYGWVEGSTPNPHYDPEFLGSAQFLRVYPPEHSQAGNDVDVMKWFIRTDDVRRNTAGHMVADVMEKIGFQINRFEGDAPTCRPYVSIERNYHLYTSGAGVGFFPTNLYTTYHSQWWIENVHHANFVTGNNESALPNYPEHDAWAECVYYPPSLEDAVQASKRATAHWTEQCITVPLFSAKAYWAYSTKVLGLVNMDAEGVENGFSFMNAYKEDGSAIRYGLTSAPHSMNPQFANWYPTYQNLDRIYSYAGVSGNYPFNPSAGMTVPPYDLTTAQPGWLQDWEIGVWNDGGENKTCMTYWVRNDSFFAETVTGNRLSNVNASDYFFSVWYTYANADANKGRYPTVQDIHHIDIRSNYSWTVYFNEGFGPYPQSWRYYYYYRRCFPASPMLFPVDVWLQEPLATLAVESFPGFTGPATVALNGTPVWINEVTVDGLPLTLGLDYNLFGHGDEGNTTLDILTAPSGDLTVDYWMYGDPSGFTPGDLLWEDVLVGGGMYYLTSFTPGVGGGATFKRNPYFWMETPPVGEVDFVWKWIEGPKPRGGYYKVDLFDVVMVIGEYGSDGTGVPDSATEHRRWFPGADFAPLGGLINIYDIVTMVGQYGQSFAAP